jgi:magnesium transporter
MIRSAVLTETAAGDVQLQLDFPLSAVPAFLTDPTKVVWVDFESNPVVEDERILREMFGFHPLAIDDALQEAHVPKVDDWGAYLYIVLHAVSFDAQRDQALATSEVDIFLGANYIVTHHDEPIGAVERVWALLQRDDRHLRHGPDHLLYRLVDEIAASYMPVVEAIDEAVDLVEDQIFDDPQRETLERIFALKRAVLHLRRILGPQREVLNKLARDDYSVIDPADRIYFRDVYDHFVRLHDITESLRDLMSGTLDTYLSVINNRMNDTMKTLTLITTLFMPISFIVGFFGMNFFTPNDPPLVWTSRAVFGLTLLAMVALPTAMFAIMRRRGWM